MDYLETVNQRSFARLTDEALDILCSLGPIVDMGAGNGYWTAILADRGVDIVAVEPNKCANEVFPRRRADHRAIVDYPDRALLMIWPTLNADWPAECVELYEGHTVAYVGDPWFMETANIGLYRALRSKGFALTCKTRINSWPQLFTDVLQVWKR